MCASFLRGVVLPIRIEVCIGEIFLCVAEFSGRPEITDGV